MICSDLPKLVKSLWNFIPILLTCSDSHMAKNAFEVFVPMSAESSARKEIIFDFFDLLAAVAARGKNNGMGGRKLSRYAGWWAFEHSDGGLGFDGGYRSWAKYVQHALTISLIAYYHQGCRCYKSFIFRLFAITLSA